MTPKINKIACRCVLLLTVASFVAFCEHRALISLYLAYDPVHYWGKDSFTLISVRTTIIKDDCLGLDYSYSLDWWYGSVMGKNSLRIHAALHGWEQREQR